MTDQRTQIFVDGNCIVCDIEVAHYKRMAPQKFDIINIATPGFQATSHGLDANDVNRHLHVRTPDGRILIGVDAFCHIWMQLWPYRWLARIVRLPGIYQLACLGYQIFARYRYLLPKRRAV